jgi:hypothetical protein
MHTFLLLVVALLPLGLNAQVGGPPRDRAKDGPPKPVPRLADGHVDLGNTKGVWNPRTIQNLAGDGKIAQIRFPDLKKASDISFQPWAKALYEERMIHTLQLNDPESKCLPPGIPRMYATPFPFQIHQLADRILFVFEGAAHVWRVVYTDGRKHSPDPNPSFLGESIGHWEGDTLVVDTIGFNENSWLDQDGHPHSDALHTVEKFTRAELDFIDYEVTIEDPKVYTAPWKFSYTIRWEGGGDLMEYICQENNKDILHMVGK